MLDVWDYAHGVQFDFIRLGKPFGNAVIESFNGRFRDECLNAKVFVSLEDAKQKMEAWRIDGNEHRSHGSLGNLVSRAFYGTGGCNQAEASRRFPVSNGLVFGEVSHSQKFFI
jgi:putative transposase